MCKARIEKASKDAGAKTAEWVAADQKVYLEFDPQKHRLVLFYRKLLMPDMIMNNTKQRMLCMKNYRHVVILIAPQLLEK